MRTYTLSPTQVFLSYSHDSPGHLERVLALANHLRSEGVDCNIDQYESSPVEGWQQWMINQVKDAEFIIIVCTQRYAQSFQKFTEPGQGLGASWEAEVIAQDLYKSAVRNQRFIPVLFSAKDKENIPLMLQNASYYDLSTEDGYGKLYRRLTKQPEVQKPALGSIRLMPPRESAVGMLKPTPNTPASTDLLGQLSATGWNFFALEPSLPVLEATYQAVHEDPNYIEYAYEGGFLRLFLSPKGGSIFAFAVHSSNPTYETYKNLASTDDCAVYAGAPYVFVCRVSPLAYDNYVALAGPTWTAAELLRRLGLPSYTAHAHGVGHTLYAFVPQGLLFAGHNGWQLLRPSRSLSRDNYRHAILQEIGDFAAATHRKFELVRQALDRGKVSADGRFRAGQLSLGGYWANWIVIERAGRAEVRRNTGYFISGYHWLDDRRLVYGTSGPLEPAFYVLDAASGNQDEVGRVKTPIRTFGVAGPKRLWYETPDGQRYELDVP